MMGSAEDMCVYVCVYASVRVYVCERSRLCVM